MKFRLFKIEYVIVFFFIIRLIGITNPPLELSHNWRQVTGLMVARNFYENHFDMFKPCTDETQGKTGVIGMEFPLLNALHYGFAKVFGYQHWYGRLINLIISSLGILFFYKLIVISGFTEQHARYAVFLLAASIWFSFSRKMMPDTFCISIMIIAIFMALKYLNTQNVLYLAAFIILSTLAALSKIPAAMYLILLFPVCFVYSKSTYQRLLLLCAISIPLLAVWFWYFYWNPKLALTYGNWYNSGRSLQIGFLELISHLKLLAERFYFDAFSGYLGFILSLAGLLLLVYNRFRKALFAVMLLTLVFCIYMIKSGYFFYHHNYYIIPFVPVLAFTGAYALTCITSKRIVVTCITFICIEGILNQQHDFFIKPGEYYKLQAESVMNTVSIQSDKIAVLGSENPQVLYFSHRKGWVCTQNQILDKAYWRYLYRNTCKFVLVNTHEVSSEHILQLPFKTCYKNSDFTVLKCDSL